MSFVPAFPVKGENAIYIGSESGVFYYDENLVLTQKDPESEERSSRKTDWALPGCFAGNKMTYNGKLSPKVQSGLVHHTAAGRGQEFVISTPSHELIDWVTKATASSKLYFNSGKFPAPIV